MDALIKRGLYLDPQHVIREALRELFQRYGLDPFTRKDISDLYSTDEDP